jgi:hypothetical protein
MPRFATDRGPLPFAEAFVSNPKRDQLVVLAARECGLRKKADRRPMGSWVYAGLFYHDSTKEGAIRATA